MRIPLSSLLILLGAGGPGAAGANLIPDPGFETGSSSFLWGGSLVTTSEVYAGAYAAELREEDPRWGGGYEATITGLQPNTSYTFSAYARTIGGGAVIGVKDHGSSQMTEPIDSDQYVEVSIRFMTGSASRAATVFVYNGLGNATLVYADNLSLTEDEAPPVEEEPSEYELIFSDEFNSEGSIDLSKWVPEVGFKRNNEDQYYRAENLHQAGGHLVITARRERFPNAAYEPGSSQWQRRREYADWTSGSIQTAGTFQFLYGRIECRAKVTNLDGTWPAIWTVGYGKEWPSGGEIDIMENYQGEILANFATAGSGRWNASWDASRREVSSFPSGWVDEFHVWELHWSPDEASILVDGVVLNTFDPAKTNSSSAHANPGIAPFQTFGQLLWLNLAIGGNSGGDPSGLPDETVYLVDYIRVYQKRMDRLEAAVEIPASGEEGGVRLTFDSIEGRRYTVHDSFNLEDWNAGSHLVGTGEPLSYTGSVEGEAQFLRLELDNSAWIDPETPVE